MLWNQELCICPLLLLRVCIKCNLITIFDSDRLDEYTHMLCIVVGFTIDIGVGRLFRIDLLGYTVV